MSLIDLSALILNENHYHSIIELKVNQDENNYMSALIQKINNTNILINCVK